VIAAIRSTFDALLPALIITGDSDPQLMRSMADRGIVVQHKPLEFEALQTCIMQMLDRVQMLGRGGGLALRAARACAAKQLAEPTEGALFSIY
jgi:hypothetical protein